MPDVQNNGALYGKIYDVLKDRYLQEQMKVEVF